MNLKDRSRYLLGIAGGPGSGKSALAAELARSAGAAVVALDGFHLTNAELDRRGLRGVKGSPATFDVPGFIALLERLRRGEPVSAPLYSRDLHEPIPGALPIDASAKLIVVEGNYLLLDTPPWDAVRPLLDETWFLDTPRDVCMERVRLRHIAGGCSVVEAQKKIETNDRPNYEVVAATRCRADRIR